MFVVEHFALNVHRRTYINDALRISVHIGLVHHPDA
jgi:hypothetical protein